MYKMYTIIAVTALIIGFSMGHSHTETKWEHKWALAEKEAANRHAEIIKETIRNYNERISELRRINTHAENEINKLYAVNDGLGNDVSRLQKQFRDSLRKTDCDKPTEFISTGKTENSDRELQADMFRELSNRAAEYARIADENRIRGLNCQSEYDVLVRSLNSYGIKPVDGTF